MCMKGHHYTTYTHTCNCDGPPLTVTFTLTQFTKHTCVYLIVFIPQDHKERRVRVRLHFAIQGLQADAMFEGTVEE